MDDWRIEKRKPGCAVCGRPFESEERHISTIVEIETGRFTRRDQCMGCWSTRTSEPFSYWATLAPKREQRRLEDIGAMVEFFKRLVTQPTPDESRAKVTYLTALLLMRKKRLKLLRQLRRDSTNWLALEKAWDGDVVEIIDPPITDAELDALKGEMERLFNLEFASPEPTVVAS